MQRFHKNCKELQRFHMTCKELQRFAKNGNEFATYIFLTLGVKAHLGGLGGQ